MKLHLELTSRCTLGCLECNRTLFPKTFQVTDLNYNVLLKLTENPQFDFFVLSGNNGDPIFYPKLLEWIQFRNQFFPSKKIHLETALGGKPMHWWKQLFEKLCLVDTFCVSVDGLANTNQLYRKNSNWNHIFQILQLGSSYDFFKIWKCIVFSTNEFELEKIKQLANQWNYRFQLVQTRMPTNKWLLPKHTDINIYKRQLEIYKNGN